MIVDTDVLIDVMGDDEQAKREVADLESARVPLRISSVSLFELYHGLERVEGPGDRRRQ